MIYLFIVIFVAEINSPVSTVINSLSLLAIEIKQGTKITEITTKKEKESSIMITSNDLISRQ